MNTVNINGQTYKSVHSISVSNGKVKIDGKTVDHGDTKNGILEVKVEGTLENITTDCSVTCDDVRGTVQAGGSVSCNNVGGDVQCGGSVSCDKVSGSVMAGGSISHG